MIAFCQVIVLIFAIETHDSGLPFISTHMSHPRAFTYPFFNRMLDVSCFAFHLLLGNQLMLNCKCKCKYYYSSDGVINLKQVGISHLSIWSTTLHEQTSMSDLHFTSCPRYACPWIVIYQILWNLFTRLAFLVKLSSHNYCWETRTPECTSVTVMSRNTCSEKAKNRKCFCASTGGSSLGTNTSSLMIHPASSVAANVSQSVDCC